MLSLQDLYPLAARAFGVPVPAAPAWETVLKAATLDIVEPGEQSYLDVRGKAYDWLRRVKGRKTDYGARNRVSQLLYYRKKAQRERDPGIIRDVDRAIRMGVEAIGCARKRSPREGVTVLALLAAPRYDEQASTT